MDPKLTSAIWRILRGVGMKKTGITNDIITVVMSKVSNNMEWFRYVEHCAIRISRMVFIAGSTTYCSTLVDSSTHRTEHTILVARSEHKEKIEGNMRRHMSEGAAHSCLLLVDYGVLDE